MPEWIQTIWYETGLLVSNGRQQLLSLCAEHYLVTDTMLQMKNRLKPTWQYPRSKHWHLLDYVIIRQKDREDVTITQVMCGAECWIDHHMVSSSSSNTLSKENPKQKIQLCSPQ